MNPYLEGVIAYFQHLPYEYGSNRYMYDPKSAHEWCLGYDDAAASRPLNPYPEQNKEEK